MGGGVIANRGELCESGHRSLKDLGSDPLVCGLLVLYGVHPVPFESRVAEALERVAPKLRKQSGSAELLGISENAVRIAVQGSGSGCHSSPDALKEMVEQAVREMAPEVTELVSTSQNGLVPAPAAVAAPAPEALASSVGEAMNLLRKG